MENKPHQFASAGRLPASKHLSETGRWHARTIWYFTRKHVLWTIGMQCFTAWLIPFLLLCDSFVPPLALPCSLCILLSDTGGCRCAGSNPRADSPQKVRQTQVSLRRVSGLLCVVQMDVRYIGYSSLTSLGTQVSSGVKTQNWVDFSQPLRSLLQTINATPGPRRCTRSLHSAQTLPNFTAIDVMNDLTGMCSGSVL